MNNINEYKTYYKNVTIDTVGANLVNGEKEIVQSCKAKFWALEINGTEFNADMFNLCSDGVPISSVEALKKTRLGYIKMGNYWWLLTVNNKGDLIKQKVNIKFDKIHDDMTEHYQGCDQLICSEIVNKQIFI